MNTEELKKLAAYLAVMGIIAIAIYGNYLPLKKSQAFIRAMSEVGAARSLNDFQTIIAKPLETPSPIGQEEIVRNTVNTLILNVLRSNNLQPQVVGILVEFINKYFDPLLARGHGGSFQQDLYLMGLVNQVSFLQTKDPRYLQQSEKYYAQAHEIAPLRPQAMYGLFDVRRLAGDRKGAEEIASKILSIWPDDENVRKALADFLKNTSTSTKPASKK